MQDSIVEKFNPEDIAVFGLTRNETPYDWLIDYVTDKGITFDMLYNADQVFELYGVYRDPTYVLIDKQGQIGFRDSDYYSYRIHELIVLIQELIKG